MALLTATQVTITGTTATYTAADAGGETFRPDDRTVLRVKNGSGVSVTATVVVPGTLYGQNRPDIGVVIAAGAEAAIGPFPQDLADPTTGLVNVTYTAVTSVTRVLHRI